MVAPPSGRAWVRGLFLVVIGITCAGIAPFILKRARPWPPHDGTVTVDPHPPAVIARVVSAVPSPMKDAEPARSGVAIRVTDGERPLGPEDTTTVRIYDDPFGEARGEAWSGGYDEAHERWQFVPASRGESSAPAGIVIAADGYLPFHGAETLRPGDSIEVALLPDAEVHGRVVDEQGSPATGIDLTLVLPAPARATLRRLQEVPTHRQRGVTRRRLAQTQDDGVFSFLGVVPAAGYQLVIDGAGFARTGRWLSVFAGVNELGSLVLGRGRRLRVVVYGGATERESFRVTVKTLRGAWQREVVASAERDRELTITGLTRERKRVVAHRYLKDGRYEFAAGATDALLEGAETARVELFVNAERPLTLTVLGPTVPPDGTGATLPVAGATVKVKSASRREYSTPLLKTGQNGTVTVVGLPPGAAAVDVFPPLGRDLGATQRRIEISRAGATAVEVVLQPLPKPGVDADATTIEAALARPEALPAGIATRWLLFADGTGLVRARDTVGGLGSRFSVPRVSGTRYRVACLAGGRWGERTIVVPDRPRVPAEIRLRGPSSMVSGCVITAGRPAVGELLLFDANDEGPRHPWLRSRAIVHAVLDGDGAFLFDEFPPTDSIYDVVLSRAGAVPRKVSVARFRGEPGVIELGIIELDAGTAPPDGGSNR